MVKMFWHVNRIGISACLLAVLAVAHAQATTIDRSVEFRDQYKSVPALESDDFSTQAKPWRPDEKTAVRNLVAGIKDRHPDLFARLTAVRRLRLYRVNEIFFYNPGPGRISGYAVLVKNGIILPDTTVADIVKSHGSKGADRAAKFQNIATIAHEMAHLIDQDHLTSTKAWFDLVNPRLTAFRKAIGANGADEYRRAELAPTYGFPTGYAATSPVEAFAEYVGFIVAQPEVRIPEDIKAFIQANVFAKASPEDATLFEFSRAMSAADKGDLKTAKRSLEALLAKSPNLFAALSARWKLLIEEKKFEAAISDISRMLGLAENMNLGAWRVSKYRTQRGDIYVKFKKRELALADFTAALKADPENVIALRSRAQLFIDKYKPKEALSDIDVALKLRPKNWLFLYMRGIAHKIAKQYKQSINDLNRIFQLVPSAKDDPVLFAEILAHRASAYGSLGRHRDAAADYGKALKADPTKKYLRMNMGTAYFLARDFQKADMVFTAIISDNKTKKSGKTNAYTRRYKNREQMKRYAEAAADAARVIELTGPWNNRAYVDHADLLRLAAKYDEAIQAYTELLKLYGGKRKTKLYGGQRKFAGQIYGRLGQLKVLSKQYEAAVQDLNKAIELRPDYAILYLERGRAYLSFGKEALAVRDFQNAIKKAPPKLVKKMKGWVKEATKK